MPLPVGNAPCSWGVEFADDPRNPPWQKVLDDAMQAGYSGMELGPIGFMPEDPAILGEAFAARGLSLVGGVVFRPFHDATKWAEVRGAAWRTCKSLAALNGRRLVLIDSISPRRAPTAGRGAEAERLTGSDRAAFIERIQTVATMAAEEFGLEPSLHAHAAGYVEFEDELEGVLEAIDPKVLGICLDTGHSAYAGFDPVALYKRHADRVTYLHFKDVDPEVRAHVVANRIGFYDACAGGLFCNLGDGIVDFAALRDALAANGYSGWATVEQDCDPSGATSPIDDARANLRYLESVGIA
jgi:inosose dehydratase